MWTNTISLKQSQNTSSSIILFFNRNFSGDDYFFNRIYFDNENDIVKSLKFLKRFLTLEGISGYLYIKNEKTTSSFLRKQLKKSGFICVDSIYTLESPPPSLPSPIQVITTTINLEKKISVTKIVDDPILLNTWTRIFCQSFNIKD